MRNKKGKKKVGTKTADKSEQRNAASGLIPLSLRERGRRRAKLGDPAWFNSRREERPAPKYTKSAGGVLLPKHLLKGANALVHKSFVPVEAELSLSPAIVGRPTQRLLRRFSGKKVIPANDTWIEGNDDRQIYFDATFPWCSIGQVITPTGRGTGTLAGKNFVLTASHVVAGLWTPGQPLTQPITFVPAMFGGSSILGPTWTANVTGIAAWKEINDVVGYDVAICQLDQPMGDWLGAFGSRGYSEDWEGNAWWEHAGYPYDLSPNGDQPCYQFQITIDDDDDDDFDTVELETDADIASGQSGGPLWAIFNDGGHQIVGVLSGRDDDFLESSNVFAGGSGLNALVKWGRDNWG
jgi:V8-like Glu-specific endopeptidase